MNEVGGLIQSAIQGVLDKIHQKDRTTQNNKNTLRKVEAKLQSMEQQVGCLMNITQQVKEMFKRLKDLRVEIGELSLATSDEFKRV